MNFVNNIYRATFLDIILLIKGYRFNLQLKETLKRSLIIIMVFFIGTFFCAAQTPTIDSLRNTLSKTTKIKKQITIYNELSDQLHGINFEESLAYAHKALKLTQKIQDKEKEITSLFLLGNLIYDSTVRDSALFYYERGERMARDHNLKKLQSDFLMRMANWYRYHEVDSTKTVNYLFKSIAICKASKHYHGTARSYAKLASFYTRYKEVKLCEDYLEKSAKYYLKTSGGEKTIAHYYNEVGYKTWDFNPKKSLEFYFKGLTYEKTNGNLKVSLANAYNTIGEPLIALNYLEEAIENFNEKKHNRTKGVALAQLAEAYLKLNKTKKALKICDEGILFLTPLSISNQSGLPSLYRSKGVLMEKNNNSKSALEFYKKSLDIAKKVFEPFEVVKANITLGKFYEDKFPKKSEAYCKSALLQAKNGNFNNLELEANECLYNIYKKKNIYEKALKYHERKVILNDSLGTIKVEHALAINNKIAQKDKQLAQELHLKKIKEQELKNKNTTISILVLSFILGIALIGFLMKSNQKVSNQNYEITKKTKELERSNEELERFAHVASHDLKSPLNNIILCSAILRESLKKEPNPSVHESLDYIEKSGTSMKSLIDDILQYSKLSNQENKRLEVINLNTLINEISQLVITNKNGDSKKIEATHLPNIKWNHPKIFLLFKNLIENGLKYNTSLIPTVKIYFTKQEKSYFICIEDNGIGIKKEHHSAVFTMFKRLHNKSEYDGTGLGLATCKKIAEEFNGKIEVTSKIDKGTIFSIEIPKKIIVPKLQKAQ